MLTNTWRTALAFAVGLVAAAPAPALAAPTDHESRLLGRAIYPATQYQPGPPSGFGITAANGVTPPFSGQPIPGMSAAIYLGRGDYLAQPDNGFGAKGNSADFLLRAYVVHPNFRTEDGGDGSVTIKKRIEYRDPDHKVPFALTRPDRLLTGADFDIESLRIAKDGTLWIGDEFGPFLLHTSADGVVLEAPIALPGVRSPQNPYLAPGEKPTQPASRGFEGMAISKDGKKLYPILEGAPLSAPAGSRLRTLYEFDIPSRAYTGRTWTYETEAGYGEVTIGDFTELDQHRFLAIERDNFDGPAARLKRVYEVDLRRSDDRGVLQKRLVLDALNIRDPEGVSLPARPGEYGVGDPFKFPVQSFETITVVGGNRLFTTNDNNFPFNSGRWVSGQVSPRPDDLEFLLLRVPGLRHGAGADLAPQGEDD